MSLVDDPLMMPIRIGAFIRQAGISCTGCGLEPQRPQRCKFTLLVYLPAIDREPLSMAEALPFIGDPRTSPVEVDELKTFPPQ